MEVGLVGQPFVGKTSLFRALAGAGHHAPADARKAVTGVAAIPDPRLPLIASFIPTKQIVPATLQLVDTPGLAPGEAGAERVLGAIRQVDALCHVVRCFDAGGDPSSPARDIEALETELILADLQIVENALPRAERAAKSREGPAVARFETLKILSPALEEGKPVRALIASGALVKPEHDRAMRELGMLSAKQVLFVANVADDDVAGAGAAAQTVRDIAKREDMEAIALSAALEAELAEMDEQDRAEMLEGLGLKEPAIGALARALYALLGLQSFYTAGDKEVRAWTTHEGASAPTAAGKIHSDIERGFIRAEIYSVDDLVEYKTEKAIRDAGKMRTEGKSYTMRDGDVCNFLFNV